MSIMDEFLLDKQTDVGVNSRVTHFLSFTF